MIKSKNGIYEAQPNEVLFKEGEAGDCAYIIESGRILIFVTKDGEEIPLSILGPGEIFGEMALIDNSMRSASARAIENVVINQVTKSQLLERMNIADPIVRVLLKVLLKRLRASNVAVEGFSIPTGPAEEIVPTQLADNFDSLKRENEIFEAFQNNEFELFYQPIINLADRSIVGAEALLRWISPTKGVVFPNAFIDVIENSSLVVPIGQWIIERALRDVKTLQASMRASGYNGHPDDFIMSINISGRQFAHPQFLPKLEEARVEAGVKVGNVKLEITERIMMDGTLALDVLNKCHSAGYKISIDDFGTGFSCLQYLTLMPISYLKIDRSFVKRLQIDEKSMAVVNSIIYLAKSLNVEIIAEGIETEIEAGLLKELGSHMGQGYLYGKPVELSKFLEHFSKVS